MNELPFLYSLQSMGSQYAFYYKKENQQPVFKANCSRFSSASIIKIPLLLAWIYLERTGEVNRAEICNLDDEAQVRGAGLAHLLAARRMPYQDVLLMMIALSDNLCTNLVIQHIGMQRAQGIFHDVFQLNGTFLQRKMMDFEARTRGLDNWISAEDCIRLFELVDQLIPEERKWFDSMLRMCQHSLLLLRDIPEDSIVFYHKTGSIAGVMHDWGYMRDRRIFLLTQHVEDERKMMEIFGKAGRLLVDD
jgi:beta-lactamase class A